MDEQGPAEDVRKPESVWTIVRRLGLFLLVAAVAVVLTHFTPIGKYFSLDAITQLSEKLGNWGPAVLVLLGIVTPLLFIPRWPIAFVGGLLYGVVWGTVLATVGSSIGAMVHYYLSRSLLSPFSERVRKKMNWTGAAIPKDKQILALFLLRAFPLSNFVATNMMAGALRLHSMRYFYGSFLGMIPSSIMYAAWGKLMKQPSPGYYALAVGILLAVIAGAYFGQRMFARWQEENKTADGHENEKPL